MAGNLTLALIKPHIHMERKVGQVIQRIEDSGFGIILSKMVHLRPEGADQFYAEHKGKDFFEKLKRYMCVGPLWVLVLTKDNAVEEWRKTIGATDPAKAEPGTIRHEFGRHDNVTLNAVHGSATDHDAKREINFFFWREIQLAERIEALDQQS
jgi:nucleoside-diphosphate kinase